MNPIGKIKGRKMMKAAENHHFFVVVLFVFDFFCLTEMTKGSKTCAKNL